VDRVIRLFEKVLKPTFNSLRLKVRLMMYMRLLGVRVLETWLSLSVEVVEGLGVVQEDKLPFLTVRKSQEGLVQGP